MFCIVGQGSSEALSPQKYQQPPTPILRLPPLNQSINYSIAAPLAIRPPPSGGVGKTQEHRRAVRHEDPQEGRRGAEAAGGADQDREEGARERRAPVLDAAALRLPGAVFFFFTAYCCCTRAILSFKCEIEGGVSVTLTLTVNPKPRPRPLSGQPSQVSVFCEGYCVFLSSAAAVASVPAAVEAQGRSLLCVWSGATSVFEKASAIYL